MSTTAEQNTTRDSRTVFEKACRDAGLRLTPQRLVIWGALAGNKEHPTAEMVHNRVKETLPTVSLDTVYRTLSTFEEMGLVTRVQTADDSTRFEPDPTPHHHIICTRCKKVFDFEWEEFEAQNLPFDSKEIGRIVEKQVIVRAVCNECLKKES